MTEPLDHFLAQCCAEIERRAGCQKGTLPVLAEGAEAFRQAMKTATLLDATPASQPVLEQLHALDRSPLIDALLPAVDSFPWVEYPPLADAGSQVALGRINHVRDFGALNCGLMLIGAGCTFPLHHHPPQELYLPLVDSGRWQVGGSTEFRSFGTDELPYNNPDDIHSVQAGDEPLVALFVLWP